MATPSFVNVVKHAGIYGLGSIGIRIAGLFLIPVYTYNLTPAEYGVIEYLDLMAMALSMLFSLGLGNAIYRYYYLEDAPDARAKVVSTALLPIMAVAVVISAFMIAISPVLAARLFHDEHFTKYLRILFLGFGFNAVAEFGMTYLAVLQRSAIYSAINVLKFLVSVSLNIWFLIGLHWRVEGILVSNLITNVVFGAILLVFVVRRTGLAFEMPRLRAMVSYGYPLVLVQVSLFAVNFADRFFLQAYTSFTQVGIYALAYKFGIMLNTLISSSFFQIWNAKAFEVAKEPEARPFYQRVFFYFCVGLLLAGVGMSLVVRDVIGIMAPVAYGAAAGLVPFVILAYVLNGVGTYFELGLKLANRTVVLGGIFAGTAALCIGLYALLIPRFGMKGAVAATVIAFLVKGIWVHAASRRHYEIRYPFRRIVPIAAAGFAVVAIRSLLPPLPRIASVGAGLALFAIFVCVIFLTGWIRPDERAAAGAMLRRLTGWSRGAPTVEVP